MRYGATNLAVASSTCSDCVIGRAPTSRTRLCDSGWPGGARVPRRCSIWLGPFPRPSRPYDMRWRSCCEWTMWRVHALALVRSAEILARNGSQGYLFSPRLARRACPVAGSASGEHRACNAGVTAYAYDLVMADVFDQYAMADA